VAILPRIRSPGFMKTALLSNLFKALSQNQQEKYLAKTKGYLACSI